MRNLFSAGLRKLRAQEPALAPGHRRAHVLAVTARKGGVGKTTTAVNLACALAAGHRQRVLVVDVDPQGHVGAALREIVPSREAETASVAEVLLADRGRDMLEAVVETSVSGLHVTPPDKTLAEAESMLATRVGREFILQRALRTARTHFDTILIDCPPNLGHLTLNALVAADQVIVPCDMSVLAFEGVADLFETIETVNLRLNHPLDVLGIVRTRVDRRNATITHDVERLLADNYGNRVLDTVIPVNSALARAQAKGLSIFEFDRSSRGALAYRALADEVIGRLASDVDHAANQ